MNWATSFAIVGSAWAFGFYALVYLSVRNDMKHDNCKAEEKEKVK